MSLSTVRHVVAAVAACTVGIVPVLVGTLAPAAAVTPDGGATTRAGAAASDWFVDPRSRAERRAEIAVPARPKDYSGAVTDTRAVYRTRSGDLAVPVRLALGNTVEQGQALTLDGNGLFLVNTTTLTAVARVQLERLAVSLRDASSIRCEGYADYAGKVAHHRDLARERAGRVCDALASLSDGLQTSAVGYGSGRPAVVGGRSADRRLNRRVVVQMTGTRPALLDPPVVVPPVVVPPVVVPPVEPPVVVPPVPAVEVPGAPVLDAASGQDGVVHYAFTPPSTDGGSPVTGYEVAWDGHAWAPVSDGLLLGASRGRLRAGLGGVLTGVLTGTPVGVAVRAVNAVGAGAPSNTLSVTSYGRPSAPRNLVASVDGTAVQLSFDAPAADGGRTITGYAVQADDGSWADVPVTGTSRLEVTLTAQPDGQHGYRVRAVNEVGASPASAPVTVQVTAPRPDAPTITVMGYNSWYASWDVYFVAGADNGAVVTGFEASVAGGPWIASSGLMGNHALFSCPGMACDWTYSSSVRLRAVTATGASEPSHPYTPPPI